MEVGRTECVMDNLNPVWQKMVLRTDSSQLRKKKLTRIQFGHHSSSIHLK